MKKLILALICGLTGVGAGVTAGVVTNTPEYVFSHAISNLVEDFEKRDDVSAITSIFENGSIEAKVSSEDMEMSGSTKVYFDMDDEVVYFENINYEVASEEINLNAYLSNDMVFVESEELLDGKYGISLKNIAERFEDSIFCDEDSEFGLDKDSQEILINLFEYFEDDLKSLEKDSKKLLERYSTQLGKLIKEYGEFESDTKKVKLNGERSEKRVVTLTIDEDDLYDILYDLIEFIIDDDKFEEYIYTHLSNFMHVFMVRGNTSNGLDPDDIYDEIIDGLEMVQDQLYVMEEVDFEIEISVVTPKLSNNLLKLMIEVESVGQKEEIEIDFGEDGVKKTKNINLYANGDKVLGYEIIESSKQLFKARLNGPESDEYLELELNKEDEEFNISFYDEELDWLINGEYIVDGNFKTFKVKKAVEYDFYRDEINLIGDLKIELTISNKDKLPKIDKDFTDLLELTEKELEEIAERVENISLDSSHVINVPYNMSEANEKLTNLGYQFEIHDSSIVDIYEQSYGISNLANMFSATNLVSGNAIEGYLFYSEQDAINNYEALKNLVGYYYGEENCQVKGRWVYLGTSGGIEDFLN